MNDVEENLLVPFSESMIESFRISGDISADLIEDSIDSIIDNPLLADIPVVRSLVGLVKISTNFRERSLLRNALQFIISLDSNDEDSTKIEKEIDNLLKNHKKMEKELGRVMLLLDRFIDVEKAQILSSFYRNYLLRKIDWKMFCELSDALDRIFLYDINALKIAYRSPYQQLEETRSLRLIATALMTDKHGLTLSDIEHGIKPKISEFGKKFIELGSIVDRRELFSKATF